MKTTGRRSENIPAVTWISMQPEASATISLKSIAEYLLETQDEIPASMPKSRLCLSPETVKVLHEAEKLMDDAEKQLSQIDADIRMPIDLDDERSEDFKIDENKLYIKSIVTTMFEKGYYDRESNIILSKKIPTSRRAIIDTGKFKEHRIGTISKPIKSADYCFVCKSNKESIKGKSQDKEAIKSPRINADEKNNDISGKLNVQRGPSIHIKGDFSIQTKNIVDIRPSEPSHNASDDLLENVAIFEYRQDPRTSDSEKVVLENIMKSKNMISRPEQVKSKTDRKCVDKLIEMSEKRMEMESCVWKTYEEVDFNLEDFSLKEPLVLTEVDLILEQQRKIIRQAYDATERFDKFLFKRLPSEDSFSCSKVEKQSTLQSKDANAKVNLRVKVNDKIKNSLVELNFSASEKLKYIKTSGEVSFTKTNARLSEDSLTTSKTHTHSEKKTSENLEHAESFNEVSSIEELSSLQESKSKIKMQKKEEAVFSSNDSSFVHTETKSNAGFIENPKSLQTLENSNLVANAHLDEKTSLPEIIKPVGNIRMDEKISFDKEKSTENGRDGKHVQTEEKENELKSTTIKKKKEMQNYDLENISDADIVEQDNKNDKGDHKNEEDIGKNTVELKDNLYENENSQKTFHLIESVLDENASDFVGEAKNNDGKIEAQVIENCDMAKSSEPESNLKLSGKLKKKENNFENQIKVNTISDFGSEKSLKFTDSRSSQDDFLNKATVNVTDNISSNDSTESKIEIKLSKARSSLNALMKTMNEQFKDSQRSITDKIEAISKESSEKNNSIDEVFTKLQNGEVNKKMIKNNKKTKDITLESTVLVTDESLTNPRSFALLLEENGAVSQDFITKQKVILLKNLESCSISNPPQSKRLFTSTIIDGIEPPNTFVKSKSSTTIKSDSSSDTYSEGEIFFSSTNSYSAGEIKRKNEQRNSNSTSKSSENNSINPNSSLSHSAGEILKN